MAHQTLLVIIPDHLSDLINKGEITTRYYNPGNLFDEVHILMTNDDKPDLTLLQKTVGQAKLYLHNLPLPSFKRTLGWQPILIDPWINSAVRLVKSINPSLIRSHGFHVHSYLVGFLKKILDIPTIISLHGNPDVDYGRLCHTLRDKLVYYRWKSLAEKYLNLIDHFIIVYSPIIPYFEERNLKNYSVIYNTVGIGAVPKTDYSIKEGHLNCICVGRQQSEQKDQRSMIQAISRLDNVTLHLYGNGDLHQELQEIAILLGVEDRVFFKKSVKNSFLMKELHKFDIYLYNSINYEISKTVIEASLIGLPIIHNTREPNLSEELLHDFIFKVDNTAEGYRQAIVHLKDHLTVRMRLGTKARAYAQQHWHPEITEMQVVNLYKSLIRE